MLVGFATAAGETPASLEGRLAKGERVVELEPVDGSSVSAVRAWAVFDAPPEQVFAIIDDCAHYAAWMPRVVSSKEPSRQGEQSVCSWVVGMPFPMKNAGTEVAVISRRAPERLTRDFKQTKGEFKRNEGSWVLTPFRGDPSRTRVDYRLFVEIDTVFPDAFVRAGQRGGVSDMLQRLGEKLAKKKP